MITLNYFTKGLAEFGNSSSTNCNGCYSNDKTYCQLTITLKKVERKVLELYNEGKTTREIAKEQRLSLRDISGIRISVERSMLVAERFIHELSTKYGKQSVSTDGGTWYPQACKFLKLEHHLHSKFEKSIIERTIQYIKDRTECFDDYFPCRKNK